MPAPLRARQTRAAARTASSPLAAEMPAEPQFSALSRTPLRPAPLSAFGPPAPEAAAMGAVVAGMGLAAGATRPVLPPSREPFPDAAPAPAPREADQPRPATPVGIERDDDDAFVGIGTLESAARIRRALSQLAAARAAFGADLGTAHQRRCLTIAANHAAAAERLAQSAESLKAGLG